MTTAAELDERYGRAPSPRRRRAWWITVGVVFVAFFGYLAWTVISSNISAVRADGVTMEVLDERTVEISFQVSGPPDRVYACAMEALDEEFGIVGWRVVLLPASEQHTRVFREQIPTVAGATTGLVNSCWVA